MPLWNAAGLALIGAGASAAFNLASKAAYYFGDLQLGFPQFQRQTTCIGLEADMRNALKDAIESVDNIDYIIVELPDQVLIQSKNKQSTYEDKKHIPGSGMASDTESLNFRNPNDAYKHAVSKGLYDKPDGIYKLARGKNVEPQHEDAKDKVLRSQAEERSNWARRRFGGNRDNIKLEGAYKAFTSLLQDMVRSSKYGECVNHSGVSHIAISWGNKPAAPETEDTEQAAEEKPVQSRHILLKPLSKQELQVFKSMGITDMVHDADGNELGGMGMIDALVKVRAQIVEDDCAKREKNKDLKKLSQLAWQTPKIM